MKYGIIHATASAVEPLQSAIKKIAPEAQVVNFVNEEMLQYVNRNGSVDAKALRMFAREIFCAQEAEPDAIMVACNVFAPHIDTIKPFVQVPVLAVDEAMQKKAAAMGGKIGVMGTNSSAVPSCCAGIRKAFEESCTGKESGKEIKFSDGTVPEAAAALAGGDLKEFDRLLTEKALELQKEECTLIVLSQLTMARAKEAMLRAGVTVPVLTTPEEGAAALVNHQSRGRFSD